MMAAIENNPENERFPIRKILWSILVGIGGNVLVFLFLTTFLNFYAALKFIPWIIAFNCALTGYMMLDKTRSTLKYKKGFAILSGSLVVVAVSLFVVTALPNMIGTFQITVYDLFSWAFIGATLSGMGAMLAIKYFNIK